MMLSRLKDWLEDMPADWLNLETTLADQETKIADQAAADKLNAVGTANSGDEVAEHEDPLAAADFVKLELDSGEGIAKCIHT